MAIIFQVLDFLGTIKIPMGSFTVDMKSVLYLTFAGWLINLILKGLGYLKDTHVKEFTVSDKDEGK